mgnify:CR=1 FL=1
MWPARGTRVTNLVQDGVAIRGDAPDLRAVLQEHLDDLGVSAA